MKSILKIIVAAGILAAIVPTSPAQTSVTSVTNVVTVLVTNVVTITNVVVAAPAPAPAPAPAAAAVEMGKKYPWASSITAGLTMTRGNSQSLLYSAEIMTTKKTPKNEYAFGLLGAYGNQNSVESVNNYKAFGQWNHLFSDRFYSYVHADATRDLIANLDYRLNVGPGAGYYLIKEKNTSLSTEAGVGYQNEHLGGNYNSFATVRLAESFEHKFGTVARVWQTVELLPQVDNFDNYIVNFEIGVEAAISKSLSLKTALDDAFQNQPAAGRRQNDVKLVSGIVYKF
jgi:putative salt-induced outer membrane protein